MNCVHSTGGHRRIASRITTASRREEETFSLDSVISLGEFYPEGNQSHNLHAGVSAMLMPPLCAELTWTPFSVSVHQEEL